MSDQASHEFDPDLLDLHLGRLDDRQRRELEQRLQSDAALAAEHEALSVMFAALRAYRDETPTVRPELVSDICRRVAAAGAPPRVVQPEPDLAALAERENGGIIRLSSLRDIMAVAAMIVLAVGLGVPSLLHMRERGRRIACSANLASLGRGMQTYALANGESLPFVGWNARLSWQPTGDPGLELQPNHRHAYLLVRNRLVPPEVFVCPSSPDVPMPADMVAAFSDFPESRNISYAYQNMAGARPSLRANPDLPVFGDDNPLFDNGVPLLSSLSLRKPSETNSRVHRGAGQNVLTLRGNVRWTTTPNCGIAGDNIWTLRDVSEYTGREGPRDSADAHLLK